MAKQFLPSVNIVTCYASHGLNLILRCIKSFVLALFACELSGGTTLLSPE